MAAETYIRTVFPNGAVVVVTETGAVITPGPGGAMPPDWQATWPNATVQS